MSRRKPQPPPLTSGATRSYTLKVVCGSDRHPRTVLHHLADMRGYDYPHAFRALEGRNKLRVRTAEDGAVLYCFRCSRCGGTPRPVPEETLARAYDELSALAGEHHPVLDITAIR